MTLRLDFAALRDQVLLINRSTADGSVQRFDWSGSGFTLNFSGNCIKIHFNRQTVDQPICLELCLDGQKWRHPVSTGAESAVISCTEGAHQLRLLRISEGCNYLTVTGVEVMGDHPALLPPPARKERKIVFFGDSITCGYGNLGSPDNRVFFTCEEDVTRAYALLTAEALDCDWRLIAVSGQGIVRNCNGDKDYQISDFYAHQSRVSRQIHDFASWQPDVVVVNAGTNDRGGQVTDEEFHDAAGIFLDNLRKVYPKAKIVWFIGLMGCPYRKVLEELAGERDGVYFLPTATISAAADEFGANGHPGVRGAARGAEELTAFLRELMNW